MYAADSPAIHCVYLSVCLASRYTWTWCEERRDTVRSGRTADAPATGSWAAGAWWRPVGRRLSTARLPRAPIPQSASSALAPARGSTHQGTIRGSSACCTKCMGFEVAGTIREISSRRSFIALRGVRSYAPVFSPGRFRCVRATGRPACSYQGFVASARHRHLLQSSRSNKCV
jgi:hypothetical protein